MKIAIIGTFQVGKSTLVNCLIHSAIAGVGRGLPTTHTLNYYKNSSAPVLLCRDITGKCLFERKWTDLQPGFKFPVETTRIFCYLPEDTNYLNGNTLIDTPGLDSTGRDASADTLHTMNIIKDNTVDLLLLVVSNSQLDSAIRKQVLPWIRESKKSLAVLMNCNQNDPDPSSRQNQRTAEQIDEELRGEGIRHNRLDLQSKTKVLPCNIVWYWLAQCNASEDCFYDEGTKNIFLERLQQWRNYYEYVLEQPVPSKDILAKKSKLPALFSYLNGSELREQLWKQDNPALSNDDLIAKLQRLVNC